MLALALSGCATTHSRDREWKLPAGLGSYVLSAQITDGFLVRNAVVSVNGQPVLKGRAYLWSNKISMASTVDEFPIAAVCDRKARVCDVSIAGFHAVALDYCTGRQGATAGRGERRA